MQNLLFSIFVMMLSVSGFLQAFEYPWCMQSEILRTFYPQVENGLGLRVDAEVLCLHPREESIVLTNQFTNLFTTPDVTLKPVIQPNLNWNVGYRLGAGYQLTCDWDISLNWTHFNSWAQQTRNCTMDISLGMFPIWSLSDDIIPYDWVSKAKMHWKMNLNMVDIDCGYAYSWGDIFLIRSFAGLRGVWIDQDFDVKYGGGIFANGLDLPQLGSTFGFDNITMRNDFLGIGPQVGIDPQFNLGCGFRVYGSACATMGYGFFSVYQKEVYLTNVRYKRSASPHGIRWMLDSAAGIMYKTYVSNQQYALTCKLGWEWHVFYDQVELKGDQFGLVSSNRNLTLNGVAFSLAFDF